MDDQTTPGAPDGHDAAEPGTAAAADDLLQVVEARGPDGYGFHFKVRASGQMYRLEPARDPHQPRFWCFRIYRCLKGGMADPTERAWLGGRGMSRDELEAAAATIRADINAWLAAEPLGNLRGWLLAETPTAAAPSVIAATRGGREGRISRP